MLRWPQRLKGASMDIPVVIEPFDGHTFRARALHLGAEGGTAEEAQSRLEASVAQFFQAGGRVATLTVANGTAPPDPRTLSYGGCLKDHPLLDEWRKAMADYRRELDAEPDEP
ncbi:MAG: hypothetical protein U0746_16325 [Gemmataceae bacterium]